MKILNLKNSILALSFLTCGVSMQAQEHKQCGNVTADQEVLIKHPELKTQIENLDNFLNNVDVTQLEKNRAGLYIIPIVFHIIHNYGPENISDAQIKDEVRILNVDYQKRNADTSLIIPLFKPLIANVGFEFRLATIDPDGNCTDGIDRIFSHKTYKGNDESKINPWPRHRYFNVWVINTLQNVKAAAYAYKPATAAFMPYYDGVLAWHEYIGSIGTSDPLRDGTLTHEIGHCLNLDHPWGSTNDPGVACGDDNVSDTPPTKGHETCVNLYDSVCTPGVVENVQNFMDYSYCANEMFTIGQKDRMITALTSPVAQRSSLYSAQTAAATGILDGQVANCAPIADFNSTNRFVCIGNTSALKDYSHKNTISSVEWTLNGGSPATSTAKNVSVSYTTAGWKDVTLKATNPSNVSSSTTKASYIYVSDPTDKNSTNIANEFENPTDYDRWPLFNYFNNQFKWKYYDGGNVPSGWRALMFDGFDNRTFPANLTETPFQDIDDVITPSYTTTGLTGGFVSFKLAAASTGGNISQLDDTLGIYYSANCGSTWVLLQNLFQSTLINNGAVLTAFYPDNSTTWSTVAAQLPASAIGANVYFKLRHRAGTYSNNLFIDNFMVGSMPTAVSELNTNGINFTLVPNPATENSEVVINTLTSDNVTISVTDMIGRTVYSEIVKTNANQTSSFQLPSAIFNTKGLYMVTVSDKNNKSSKKLVIQ